MLSKPEGTVLVAAVHRPAAKKSAKDLPPRAAALLAEARGDVAAHELDQAEKDYLEIIKIERKECFRAGRIWRPSQVDLNHTADAEKNSDRRRWRLTRTMITACL